jgi:hypothetical protein
MAFESAEGEAVAPAEALTQDADQAQPKLGVLFLGLTAILMFFGAVGLVLYLKPGGDSPTPATIFVAGPLTAFEPGSVTYFESEHLFIVRLMDGALLALYDLGPRMQMGVGELPQGQRRQPGAVLPAGFEETGFNQLCDGGWWDATGKGLSGPINGDLDRFPVRVVDGIVQVDVVERRCMNPVSDMAPCSPTQ